MSLFLASIKDALPFFLSQRTNFPFKIDDPFFLFLHPCHQLLLRTPLASLARHEPPVLADDPHNVVLVRPHQEIEPIEEVPDGRKPTVAPTPVDISNLEVG